MTCGDTFIQNTMCGQLVHVCVLSDDPDSDGWDHDEHDETSGFHVCKCGFSWQKTLGYEKTQQPTN